MPIEPRREDSEQKHVTAGGAIPSKMRITRVCSVPGCSVFQVQRHRHTCSTDRGVYNHHCMQQDDAGAQQRPLHSRSADVNPMSYPPKIVTAFRVSKISALPRSYRPSPRNSKNLPESVQGLARLLQHLQSILIYAGYLAPGARLGCAHVNPADSDLGPIVLRERPPPSHDDAVMPPKKVVTTPRRTGGAGRQQQKKFQMLRKHNEQLAKNHTICACYLSALDPRIFERVPCRVFKSLSKI